MKKHFSEGLLWLGLVLPILLAPAKNSRAQCVSCDPLPNTGTALYYNFNSYTAVIGGSISGEDVYRQDVTESCGGGVCDDPYDSCACHPAPMTLVGSGTYPIPSSLITSSGSYNFTIPASYGYTGFTIPFNNTTNVDHDRTGTLTVTTTYPPTGGGKYTSATITLLNTNSVVSVTVPGYGNNYSGTNLLACGVSGSSNCIIRFSRNSAYEQRTIYYTVSGTYQSSNYTASPALSGTITMPSGATNVDISLSATNWLQQTTNTIIVTLGVGNGYYRVNSLAKAITNIITPDYTTIAVAPTVTAAIRGETTGALVFARVNPYYSTSAPRTITFGTSGTAINGTDYNLSSGSPITIPAGQGAVTNLLTPTTESALAGTKIMTATLNAGSTYAVSSSNGVATMGILEDAPLISVSTSNSYAYQNAGSGGFVISRQYGLPFSLTVPYTLTGTAVNGTDYNTLPTSVTFAPNQTTTNITVIANTSPILTGAKTVVLNISPGNLYYTGVTTQAVVTLLPQSSSTNSVASPLGRYWRGSGADPTYWSIVVPQDAETGAVYSNSNGNCAALYPGLTSWTTNNYYHYNATNALSQSNSANRIQFNNPIVAFGERVGGTPLYVGQNYGFGVYAGDTKGSPMVVNVYARSNYAYVGAIDINIPTNWPVFASNGFAASYTGYGLTTTLSTTPDMNWGVMEQYQSSYVLTHTATPAALNYYYIVGIAGWPNSGLQPMAQNLGGTNSQSLLYSLEFESYPAWRSTVIDQPHFDGSPLPPYYAGMTLDELLTNTPPVTNAVSISPSACTNVNDSPELRESPILDQFVANLNNDPIALANYVINQIDLSDAIDYDDDGNVAEQSINLGGMTRGALGTYLEKEGSPLEQCALLVYLLRKAGIPAAYVFPPRDGMQILDARLSGMLRFQVQGDFNQAGELQSGTNAMIAVNYPWVAAYIGSNWVHIFPWMKDYQMVEGYNLWDYMPTNYSSAFPWVKDYIYGNSNLMSFARPGDNTPRVIFPAYVEQTLQQNFPNLSIGDIGMNIYNRQHNYARWSDFPTPTYVTNVSYTVESMSDPAVTNVDPQLTNIFDTVNVDVYSLQDPHKDLQTGPMRLVDLHNREFYITQTNSGSNQWPISLVLVPFGTNTNSTYSFTNDSALLSKEIQSTTLDQFDDQLSVRFRYYRHRADSLAYPIDPTLPFLGVSSQQQICFERPFRKGDIGAICLNYGRVTRDMINVDEQPIWSMENGLQTGSLTTNRISPDVYQGATMYLAGMSYYEQLSEFDQTNCALNKVLNISEWAAGLSKISPHRDDSGNLYNGAVDPILPNVDMFYFQTASVGNSSATPNDGETYNETLNNYNLMMIVNGSAEEHQIINTFYNQTNAVSTVRLLQLSQTQGSGVVPLNYSNYVAQGASIYQGQQLQNIDSYVWAEVADAFSSSDGAYTIGYITPGAITNSSYSGMGAFLFGWYQYSAIISPDSLNGGFGQDMPDGTISAGNTMNYDLAGDESGGMEGGDGPVLNLQTPVAGAALVPDEIATFDISEQLNYISSGVYTLDSTDAQFDQSVSSLLGEPTGNSAAATAVDLQVAQQDNFLGNTGDAGQQLGTRTADPVNTITGEFYVDETDIELPGPFPLILHRFYSSQNAANNQFGIGWRMNMMPYLSVSDDNTNIYAADMDGAVLAYADVSTNGSEIYTPILSANPELNNNNATGMGGLGNRLRNQLVKTVVHHQERYYLYGSDGTVRIFAGNMLQSWQDSAGNSFTFAYGADSTQPDFSQITKIQASNGNFLGFDYDYYGHIIDAYTGDGRWIFYYYNDYGDLTSVVLPDGSVHQYQYQLGYQSVTNGGVVSQQPYSTHLLIEEDKPEGRVLQNLYDSQNRVTNQLSTSGTNYVPVLSASFVYSNNFNLTNVSAVTGTTWIGDGRGNTTRYDYTNNLITQITDPLGQTIEQVWYPDVENAPTNLSVSEVTTVVDAPGTLYAYVASLPPSFAVNNTFTLSGYTGSASPLNATWKCTAIYPQESSVIVQFNTALLGDSFETTEPGTFTCYVPTNVPGAYPRSLSQRKDKRGLWSEYLYDSNGNVTNTVVTGDITGDGIIENATNTAIYDTNCVPLEMTDAVGNSVQFVYDTAYPLLPDQIIRFAAGIPVLTNMQYYGFASNVVANGLYLQTNVAFGLLTRQVRAYGSPDAASNDFAYNGQGFLTQTIHYTGTGDPNVTNNLFVNERGETVNVTNPVGAVTAFDYDAMGRKISEEDFDQSGNLLSWNLLYYDENGELDWVEGPRYNPENYVNFQYDGAGRVTTEIDWRSEANASGNGVQSRSGYNLYAQTFHQYDVNGNELLRVNPRGAMTANAYDPLNRLVSAQSIDIDGITLLSSQGFGYEPGGQVAYQTNGLGGVTHTQYTTTGKPEYQLLPTGATNGWRYYLDGRLHRRYLSNGSYWDTTYDDVDLLVTNIFYAAGGVPQVTNLTGLDRRGNKTLFIDEGGNPFTNVFDGLDRIRFQAGLLTTNPPVTNAPGPATAGSSFQQTVMTYYDAAGLAVTNVDALGQKHVVLFDVLGRPLSEQFLEANNTVDRQTTVTYSSDHQSATVVRGSGATAITNTIYSDFKGKPVLSIGYPAAGVQDYTWTTYDFAENPVSITRNTSSNGVATQWTSVSNAFDGLNRLISKTDRDGAVTSYKYDAANDRTNLVLPGGLNWRAGYNAALQILFDYDVGAGGGISRSNRYTYSSVTSLIQTSADGRGVSCTHYFDAFLRPSSNVYSGPLPEHNLTTAFSYDPRSLLASVAENFASPNTGPSVTVARTYDAYRQLVTDKMTGGNSYSATQAWDAAGRRAALGVGNISFGYSFRADGLVTSVSAGTGYGTGYFTYDAGGLLSSRTFSPRSTIIGSYDGEGRPRDVNTTVNGTDVLTESLAFSGDGLLTSHTLVRPDFTDHRSYAYAPQSRRLTEEVVGLNAGTNWTNTFVYDAGVTGGPGVLTSSGQPTGTNALWNGATDAFSRIASATNTVAMRQAYGFLNGTATLTALLDGNPAPVTTVGTNDNYEWRAEMQFGPGAHQLIVNALNWSGLYTASATNNFTSAAYDHTLDNYAGSGELTNRIWISSNGTTNATESLSFDARDRLHGVTYLDNTQSGYIWTATYDGLGRRLGTSTIFVTNGVALTNLAKSIAQYFDPQTPYLEVGEMDGGVATWKFYGPDVNGVYGGMEGVGGLEAVVNGPRQATPIINDARGNALALYNVSQAATIWFSSRPTAYGAAPGYEPLPLTDGAKIAQSSGWHDKWPDITGFYWLGGRHYSPVEGNWTSSDPLGHDADPSLYAFCAAGDPINMFDPDGRCAETDASASFGSVNASAVAMALNDSGQSWINGNSLAQQMNALGLSGGMAEMSPIWALASASGSYAVISGLHGGADPDYAPTYWDTETPANLILNHDAIEQDWNYLDNPDFSSGWGTAIFATAAVKLAADSGTAAGNLLTLGGLGTIENGIKTGLTQISSTAALDATQLTKTVAADTTALSTYRITQEGETFIRYESADPAYTRVTPSGGVTPGTYAAPASDGIIPPEDVIPTYNLPSPQISRPNVNILTPPAGTPIIGPRPVVGGTGNEVIFPMGF